MATSVPKMMEALTRTFRFCCGESEVSETRESTPANEAHLVDFAVRSILVDGVEEVHEQYDGGAH